MVESKKPSGWRQALFNRPVLKLFLVLLFILIASTLAQWISIRLLTLLVAPVILAAIVYVVILIGNIVSLYLIRKPLGRLLSARDIFSLLGSYVMFIVGILLVISTLFGAVEELHLGYLTHGPTTDAFNGDVIDSGDPNISHDYLYFAAVTFFTVGYGDVCPMGLCKILAIVTAFAGNIVTVVLMAIAVSVYLNRRAKPPQVPDEVG
jgi:potassium channel LctB